MTGTLSLEDTPEVTGEANISLIETVSGNLMMQEISGGVMCSSQHLLLFFVILSQVNSICYHDDVILM